MKITGIYAFIHRYSGMCYVGSAIDARRRRLAHISAAARGSENHKQLRLLSVESFDFEILEECERADLISKEAFYISFLDSSNNGFNTLSSPFESKLGSRHSAATKARIGRANAEKLKGKTLPQNVRDKIRTANLGSKRTPEQCRNISESLKGKSPSEETRNKIREKLLGIIIPDEVRRKISTAIKGKSKSKEAVEKSANSRRGKKRTAEQCARIKEGIRLAKRGLQCAH